MKTRTRIWSLMNSVLELLVGFGLVIYITRTYSLDESGRWFLFIAIFALISGLRDALIQSALIKSTVGIFTTDADNALKTNLVVTLLFELVAGTLVSMSGWLMHTELGNLLLFYPAYSFPNAFFRWQTFYWRSQFRTRTIFITNFIQILALSGGLYWLYLHPSPLYYLIVLLGGTSAVASLYASVLMPWRKLLQANVGWSHLKVILFYGSYAMMREAVSAVSSRISLFFSGSLLGLQQTAILGLSQRFAQVALLPNNAFQSLLFPSLVKSVNDNRPEELREKIESSLAQLLALTLPPALLGVVLSPWLLTWVSGDVYRSGWGLLSVFLIVSTIITPFGAAFGSLVTALHKPSVAFRVVLVNSVINIVLGFVLMKSLGLWGAPLAMLGTEVFGFIWISSIARSMAGVRFASVFTQIPFVYHRLYSKAADRFFIDRKSSSYVNP